eukprot:8834594-Pyramimonas_sp.AAC.1
MTPEEMIGKLDEAEKAWPEFKNEGGLICRPAFQCRTLDPAATEKEAADDAVAWETAYLDEDARLKNEETGERVPLPACRRKDNPK